jgi:hypothetical protein
VAVLFPDFLKQFGFYTIPVPVFSEGILKEIMPFIFLIAALGFIWLKRWGYWLLLIYNVFFMVACIALIPQNRQAPNIIMTFIELLFIIPTKRYFDNERSVAAK